MIGSSGFREVGIVVAAVALAATVGCDDAARQRRLAEEANRTARDASVTGLPQALLVRFREASGTGLDREGWELEVLQMGGEVHLRGNVRTEGLVIPIYRPMPQAEYFDLWSWLRKLPLEGWEPAEDETASPAGWRKSLEVDVVLGVDHRIVVSRHWQRPLVGAAWVSDLEGRFHSLALDLAREELARQRLEEARSPKTRAEEGLPEDPRSFRNP